MGPAGSELVSQLVEQVVAFSPAGSELAAPHQASTPIHISMVDYSLAIEPSCLLMMLD